MRRERPEMIQELCAGCPEKRVRRVARRVIEEE